MLNRKDDVLWEIAFAVEEDIPCWMELVRLVIDGFPHLKEEEYLSELKHRIRTRQALIVKDGKRQLESCSSHTTGGALIPGMPSPVQKKRDSPGISG